MMPQQERTPEGERRWHETRERAKARAKKFFDRLIVQVYPTGVFTLDEDELVKMLTSFALDERKREKSDLPVQPPTKAEQESAADQVFKQTWGAQHPDAKPRTLEHAQDSDLACFHKARAKGEPTFTLRAQDVSAPSLVREWVRRNGATCSVEKLADALRIAQAMERWPSKKAAD